MIKDFFLDGIESELQELTWSFNESKDEFNLVINSNNITFSKCDSDFDIKPDEWLRDKHKSGRIHEIGTVAVLSFLSKNIKKQVVFYDVGALFGYFSSIVKEIFPNSIVISIEGNPLSCKCIKKISPKLNSFEVMNVVLGNEEKYANYLVEGFNFIDSPDKIRFIRAKVSIKNKIKILLNRFGKSFKTQTLYSFDIKKEILPNIFKGQNISQVEIFKLDTEGSQCHFLPPYINELCSRNPILLLEMDHPDKMANFRLTNNDILQLFLDRSYLAYWLNHRKPTKVKRIFKITEEEDSNSLLLLIPNSKVDEINTKDYR